MTDRAGIVIVDDHEIVAQGFAKLLEARFDILSIAHSGDDLLSMISTRAPDCVLLDISMPGRNGLEILPDLRLARPTTKVVMLTMHVDRLLADTAVSLGAHAFVPKNCGYDELVYAIQRVLDGGIYLSPSVPKRTERSALHASHPSLSTLTPRQHEILHLLGEGQTSIAIARSLHLQECTVTYHRSGIRRKLGIDSEWGLLRYAVLMRANKDG